RQAARSSVAGAAWARSRSGAPLIRRILGVAKSPNYFRIKFPLGDLNSRMQNFRRVTGRNRHFSLRDYLAAVDSRVDIMDCAASYFFPRRQRLGPCFHARRFRQQRWMKINDSVWKGREHLLFQDAHESSEHNELHARAP